MAYESTFNAIDNILRNEAGCSTELDYIEQTSRLLFLKYLDDLEAEREMNAELKFYKDPLDFEKAKNHNRFIILKKIGETSSEELTFKKMKQHGMNGAPMGSLNLSHPDYVELKKYIEENF